MFNTVDIFNVLGVINMKKVLFLLIVTIVIASCTKTQKYVSTGAAIGGLAGNLIGNNTEGTLIGAGLGGVAGAIIADPDR